MEYMYRIFSNMAHECTGNSFESIDTETQNAIIFDVASFLMIDTSEAESLVRTLYYEPYKEDNELRVRYRIPAFVERKCLYSR